MYNRLVILGLINMGSYKERRLQQLHARPEVSKAVGPTSFPYGFNH